MTDLGGGLAGTLIVDRERGTRSYSRMIFGHFIEHFHNQVYGGIYWPNSPLADRRGFRRDVIDAMKELGTPIMRWPGGNFVSDYHWREAVGPARVPSYNMAWQVPEPNTFGTDEFIAWCREVGCEPYICTNGGNGTAEEMSAWVEYCNGTLATRNARARHLNGHSEAYAVRYWGIGNESYGEWQIGAKTIGEWGRYVAEAAKMMRRVDPSIMLSAAALPDLDWTLALLRNAGKYLDLVSIHDYWDPLWQKNEPKGYLDAILESEEPEKLIAATRQVIGVAGFADKIGIAFDEWNLRGWHHPEGNSKEALAGREKNDIAATYTMADAVFSASFLNACLKHSDIVRMANIAPSVNARGPLFVHDKGVLKRTTFHVLKMYADLLLPRLANSFVQSDRIGPENTSVAALDAVVSCDGDAGPLSLMLVNRDPERTLSLRLKADCQLIDGTFEATTLAGDAPDAFNDLDRPDRVTPQAGSLSFRDGYAELPPHAIINVRIGGTAKPIEVRSEPVADAPPVVPNDPEPIPAQQPLGTEVMTSDLGADTHTAPQLGSAADTQPNPPASAPEFEPASPAMFPPVKPRPLIDPGADAMPWPEWAEALGLAVPRDEPPPANQTNKGAETPPVQDDGEASADSSAAIDQLWPTPGVETTASFEDSESATDFGDMNGKSDQAATNGTSHPTALFRWRATSRTLMGLSNRKKRPEPREKRKKPSPS